MDINDKNINELIRQANTTTNIEEMELFKTHPNMNVRRALARNRNITSEILKILLYDRVQNVSYMAMKHPKNNEHREFENVLRPCVDCDIEEHSLDCVNCERLTDYSKTL